MYRTAQQYKHKEYHKHHHSKHSGDIKTAMKKALSLMRSLFYSEIPCSSLKLHGLFCITVSSYQEETRLKPKPIYLLYFLLRDTPSEEQVTV